MALDDKKKFNDDCLALGNKITELLFSTPKEVAVVTIIGVFGSLSLTLGIKRDDIHILLDSVLDDMES